MKIVENAIRFPVTTTVGAILIILFGTIALFRIPVQLTPTIEEPEISVSTVWPGASPLEIEREIVDEQEEQLKSLEGLQKLESTSSDSRGQINLTFQTGTDVDAALLKVTNRLQQVPSYPADADKPVTSTVGANRSAIAWFILLPAEENGYEGDVSELLTFVDEFIKPEFERVPGVGSVNMFGGREQEMHVIVDPARLASRQITVSELTAAIDRSNSNISGGDFDEGKRRYIVRTVGEYRSPEDIEDVVVAIRNEVPVYVRDVARAELGFSKPFARAYYLGQPMIAFNAVRETGSNVLEVMKGLRETRDRVSEELLTDRGLRVVQVWDETAYIESSIDLVQQSLLIGGFLAILVLLMFLRSRSSTLVIAVAIPISIIGTFLMMNWFGRTLNVISLAGMAFAVGMVVDNSIVVLENIYRHRQLGKPRVAAAYEGASEVWGAVLASTLTTIAVFVPVLFVQEEAGQLFRDIAIAISCAVGLSLVIAITVIPSMSAKILGAHEEPEEGEKGFKNLWGLVRGGHRFNDWITGSVYKILGSTRLRLIVVIGLTAAAIGLSVLIMPKTEYLPTGNQNLLFGIILPSPGHSLEENSNLRNVYMNELSYLWTSPPEERRDLPGGGIAGWFYVSLPSQVFMGIRAEDPERVRELLPEFQRVNAMIPGAIAFVTQSSLFTRGLGAGRNIDVELTGPSLEKLVQLGGQVFGRTMEVLPGAQARPIPSLDLGNPEVQIRTDRRRAAELGITNRDLGLMVNVLVDGAKASEYQYQGQELDLKVIGEETIEQRTHLIEQLPIATPSGQLVTVGSVAEVSVENGPAQIAHRERQRSITIAITPSEETPLEEAMEKIEAEILGPMEAQGQLGGIYQARMSGSADKLTQTRKSLQWNFILAIVITYLLMSALFENFIYPLVILFSVPLAALGGFLGLRIVNLFTYQALDVLTMLGFIILVGTVVNNAILIVHQSLNHMRNDQMEPREAIRESVRNRIRPIFMSVMTSVFGMLPLVVFPGAGSELYRGLGSVVIGGLIVSTVFTLFLVPSLLSLVFDLKESIARRYVVIPADQAGGET